jgi:hypothetical protein
MPGVDFGVATGAFWDSFWRVPWVSLLAAPVSFQDLIIESIRDWTGGKVILSLGVGVGLSNIVLYYLSLFKIPVFMAV